MTSKGGEEEVEPSEFSEPQLEGDSLSCAGRDWESIPQAFAATLGPRTKALDLSFNQLTTLHEIDKFTQLDSLIADNNLLDDSISFPSLPSLRTLSLNNNKIADLETLLAKIKVSYPNLRFFSMLKNPACPNYLVGGDDEEYKRYRYRVVYFLPDLKFLDSTQVTNFEKSEAKRIGQFLKVAKLSPEEVENPSHTEPSEEGSEFEGLPQDFAKLGEHRGTFGVSKYVYYGRHSEGNRFIRNSDL